MADIASLCLSHFNGLPRKGKPQPHEWTVLAGVVEESKAYGHRVVALATGTKCLGPDRMSPEGNVVVDSHAEILARRNLLRYLAAELEAPTTHVFCPPTSSDSEPLKLQPGVAFHLYISQPPCGDASIYAERADPEETKERSPKRRRISDPQDLRRTGAKPAAGTADRNHYATVGIVRTKSMRSDMPEGKRTLSMSCSDKLALWTAVGVQGAVLSLLVGPVYFESITVGGAPSTALPALRESCRRAVHRALCERLAGVALPDGMAVRVPRIILTDTTFPHHREAVEMSNRRVSACGACLNWNVTEGLHVTLGVVGLRQGASAKKHAKHAPSQRSPVSHAALIRRVVAVCKSKGLTVTSGRSGRSDAVAAVTPVPGKTFTCQQWKDSAVAYQQAKLAVLGPTAPFANWVRKGEAYRQWVV